MTSDRMQVGEGESKECGKSVECKTDVLGSFLEFLFYKDSGAGRWGEGGERVGKYVL